MIWRHESQVDIGRAVVTVGWDGDGEDYEGSLFEPPTTLEIEWEQLSHDDLELTHDERRMVLDALWAEAKLLKEEMV